MTIIYFIFVLAVLVLVHELGHFLAARFFGVKAEEFGFGFPPRIFGAQKTKAGWHWVWGGRELTAEETERPGTVYSLNWLPLGGFVKIKGENGEGKNETDSFGHKAIWKRLIILSAGVLMNVILAFVLFSVNLLAGAPQLLDSLPQGAVIHDQHLEVMQVLPDTPAKAAGVQFGDIIVSIDGQTFAQVGDLQQFVADHANIALTYNLLRGKDTVMKNITPKVLSDTGKAGIGIEIGEIGTVSYPWYAAIANGAKSTWYSLEAIVVGLYDLIRDLFIGKGVSSQVAGPVGIATMTGQMAALGWNYLLQFMAMLSLNLAIINFLPIPALDGGRVVFLIVEKIRKKPVRQELEALLHNIFFALLMILVVAITWHDVSQYSGVIGQWWRGLLK